MQDTYETYETFLGKYVPHKCKTGSSKYQYCDPSHLQVATLTVYRIQTYLYWQNTVLMAKIRF